jgi:FixJ family two-component response regulator
VDDDPSVRRGLSRLVRSAGMGAQAFASAEEFLESQTVAQDRPACVVVDLQMPGLSGLELQDRLAARPLACPAIFVSGNGDIPSTVQAMKQGAVTFLAKPFNDEDLLRAIAEALERHRILLQSGAQVHAIRQRMSELTDREREVMAWVITGALNKQIASRLSIAEKTVKVHRGRVMEKMQVSSVAELVRLCAAAGFEAAGA